MAPLRPRLHLVSHGPEHTLSRLYADRQITEVFGHEQNPYRWSFMHPRALIGISPQVLLMPVKMLDQLKDCVSPDAILSAPARDRFSNLVSAVLLYLSG